MGTRGSKGAAPHDGPHNLTNIRWSWPEHQTRTTKANETHLWTRHCAEVGCSLPDCDYGEVICGEWSK